MAQQSLQPAFFHAGDLAGFAFPEITVMHYHRIRLLLNCTVQQRLRCGDPGEDFADSAPAFHLQTIRAIITDLRDRQFLVQQLYQLFPIQHLMSPQVSQRAAGFLLQSTAP